MCFSCNLITQSTKCGTYGGLPSLSCFDCIAEIFLLIEDQDGRLCLCLNLVKQWAIDKDSNNVQRPTWKHLKKNCRRECNIISLSNVQGCNNVIIVRKIIMIIIVIIFLIIMWFTCQCTTGLDSIIVSVFVNIGWVFTNIEYYYTNTVSEAKIQRDLLILRLSDLSTLVIKY